MNTSLVSKADLHSVHTGVVFRPAPVSTCVRLTRLLVPDPCRLPPSVQQAQRDARQATFLFRRGLKVHEPELCVDVPENYDHVMVRLGGCKWP